MGGLLPGQMDASKAAVRNVGNAEIGKAVLGGLQRLEDAVNHAAFPERSQYLHVVRSAGGVDSQETHVLPYQQGGRILAANDQVVVQSTRGGQTVTYPTSELLAGRGDSSGLKVLQNAVSSQNYAEIRVTANRIDINALQQSLEHQQPHRLQSFQHGR